MMNKKGFSIGRILLIILFVSLIGLFIYSIVLGVRNLPNDPKTTSKDNLRLVSPTEYNPVTDIYNMSAYSYKNSDFANNYGNNVLNYESNSSVYFYTSIPYDLVHNYQEGFTPAVYNINTDNDILYVARDLYYANQHLIIPGWNNNGVESWSLVYNCNINVNDFYFTMYYNFPINTSIYIKFYVLTDSGSMSKVFNFTTSNIISSFGGNDILSALPNSTIVSRFGFAIYQSSSSTNRDYYLPQRNSSLSSTNGINYVNTLIQYKSYFESLSNTDKNNLFYLKFANSQYPQAFIDGYDSGYNDAINSTNQQINELNNIILGLQNDINNLNSTIDSQQVTITYLQDQLNNSSNNFKGFFFTIADVPLRTVQGMLGFEVLGVNLFQFFVGIITALGMLWLIKKIL